jgi:hypothetical protein
VIGTRLTAIAAVVLVAGLSGCMASGRSAREPTSSTTREEAAPVDDKLTWRKAKARTLTMEQEIAKLIPEDKVAEIDQKDTGLLFSCGETQHNWNGSTTVTLIEGTEESSIVKALEENYQQSAYAIETDLDIVGDYRVQLRSQDTAESYLIVKDGPGKISINSGSACFTLPEGVYPWSAV